MSISLRTKQTFGGLLIIKVMVVGKPETSKSFTEKDKAIDYFEKLRL